MSKKRKKTKSFPQWALVLITVIILTAACGMLVYFYLSGPQPKPAKVEIAATPSVTPVMGPNGAPALLHFYFLDVGNGNCVIVQSSDGRAILVDGGHEGDTDDIIACIDSLGIRSFDMAFATSPDNGHVGGMAKILATYPPAILYTTAECAASENAGPLIKSMQVRQIPVEYIRASFTSVLPWIDNLELRIVSPHDAEYDKVKDCSIMLHFQYGSTGVMLASDANKLAERLVVKAFPNHMLRANVLLVGDHGDADATSSKFLSAVKPKIAVISCGKKNPPADSVLKRLTDRGTEILYTETDGNIHITLDGVSATVVK